MTTKSSPPAVLKRQASTIARMICAAERGEQIDVRFAERITAARSKDDLSFAVVMDDKVISIHLPWAIIRDSGEVAITEFILDQMRETVRPRHEH